MSVWLTMPLLEAIPLPVIVVNAQERVVAVNCRAEALLGQGIVGRPFVTVLRQPQLGWRERFPGLAGWFADVSQRPSMLATHPK